MSSKKFDSNEHVFRPTALSVAMVEAGVNGAKLHFVREPRCMAVWKDGKRSIH